MSFIELKDVTKEYKDYEGKVLALTNVSFKVNKGEFVAVMGPSGSGKSTLLSILGVMNPPTKGKVLIDDIDTYDLKVEKQADFRKEYLGFVFQQLQLIPYLTAIENTMLPLVISTDKNNKQEKALSILKKVNLKDKAKRLPDQLSGGEQSRVAIARAIVNDALVVLADEPTGNLDSKSSENIMKLFQKLNKEGATIVMVTHDKENARYAQRIINIKDGTIRVE